MSDYVQDEVERPNYTPYQALRELRYAYSDYSLAKTEGNVDKMNEYSNRILRLETELGLKHSKFPHLNQK